MLLFRTCFMQEIKLISYIRVQIQVMLFFHITCSSIHWLVAYLKISSKNEKKVSLSYCLQVLTVSYQRVWVRLVEAPLKLLPCPIWVALLQYYWNNHNLYNSHYWPIFQQLSSFIWASSKLSLQILAIIPSLSIFLW